MPSPRLKKGIPTTDILYTYYPELAECYDPSFYVRERITHLRDIEKGVREKITSKLDKIRSVHGLEDVEVSTLVNLAIASPANCFYRIFKNVQLAELLAQAFIRYLNTSEKTAIIELATESKRQAQAHWQDVLTYCKQGNLQATLDEYVHYLTNGDGKKLNEDLADTIQMALELRTTNYTIDTFPRFKSRVQKMQSSDKEVTMVAIMLLLLRKGREKKAKIEKQTYNAVLIARSGPLYWRQLVSGKKDSISIRTAGKSCTGICQVILLIWNSVKVVSIVTSVWLFARILP